MTWCIARDGRWTGATYSGPEADLPHNVPAGCTAVEGQPGELIAAGALLPHQPPPDVRLVERQARDERDRRLQACDWTQLPDVSPSTRNAWAHYRQALRDVPGQSGWPHTITWPTPPT